MARAPIFRMRQPVFFLGLFALFYALFLVLSCESVEIAGGSSEIGNPKTVAGDQDENKGKVVGIQIGVNGPAVVVIHRKKPISSDSSAVSDSTASQIPSYQ